MAAHSNRSPSPLSSRPINPNLRNPETNSTIRRSFSGNNSFTNKPSLLTNQRRLDPITPANSPSDVGRRRSVGKDCEEKENEEKDSVLKASKLQSPAKGCKNFMAPTISAASKFTPSPRKKVLVERNDPVRTSISFSDGKAMFLSNFSQDLEPNSELGSHQNQKNENFLGSNLADSENKKAAVVESHPVSKPCKKVTFSEIPSDSQHSVITDCDGLIVESKVVSSPIAPLDADPSLPPYDPKTNYLSPRPQFIRYKPNPRIEMLKEKAMDSDELDDRLMAEMMMSEGFSDSDKASADMVIGLDEEIEVDDHVLELRSEASLPVISTTPVDEILEVEFVGNNGKKSRGLSRLMCFSVVLVLLVACVSVSVMRDELFVKDLSLSDLSGLYEQSSGVAASARLNLGRVARRVHHVMADSVSLVFKLANEVVEGEKRAPLLFMNLTDMQENAWKEAYFLKRVENVGDEFEEELDTETEEEFDEELDLEAEMDAFEEEETYAEADSDDNIQKGYEPQDYFVATEETASDSVIQTEMDDQSGAAPQNQETEVEAAIETSPDSSAFLEAEYSLETQIQIEQKEPNSVDGSATASQNQETEVEAANEVASTVVDITLDRTSFEMESTSGKGSVIAVAIPCFIAVIVGVAALVYKRNPTSSSSNVVVVQVEPNVSKKRDNGDTISNSKKPEPIQQESWQTGSEMSSSYHYQRSGANETVESSERKYTRRESLASSSESESPSYGSFTTYERIPIKTNGYGDEEIMTPVRRSSRIRKQVTST